jgi:hypothetical protein
MTPRPPATRILSAVGLSVALALLTACGDDDGPADESPGTTMPFVDGTLEPLDSTGGPGGTVLNNQPTSPAANNAPPGDDGTG